jgi:pSer/pThr/pTyr-binding forkhead associated (FHA) protein
LRERTPDDALTGGVAVTSSKGEIMGSIIIISGSGAGNYYPLGRRTNVIGRDEALPIQLLDQHVSRKHLQVHYDKEHDRYVAKDMNSRHGVVINGRRIRGEIVLSDEDVIVLGETTLMFTTSDFPDQASALAFHKTAGQRIRATMLK